MPAAPQSPPGPDVTPLRLLVVDGEPALLRVVGELARDRGHALQGACGVPAALAALSRSENPFDCVIARLELPGCVDLLAEVAGRWPDAARVLVADEAELAPAQRALQEGRVWRVLGAPLARGDVAALLDAAALRTDVLRREHELREELAFTRDSLAELLGELERRLAREVDHLRGVHDLAARLAGADSLEEVARIAVEAFSRALGGRAVRVELPSPLHGPCVEAESGIRRRGRELQLLRADGGQGPSLFVEDAGALTQRDRRVLDSLLSSTALAAKGQVHRLEREEAQHATVFALARLAERRDDETGQHLIRVSEYSRLIALGLRADGVYAGELSDQLIDDVARSAPLHDIGKVGIPDQILLKPGTLTEGEWEVMRRHTTIGGDTLRSVIENTPRPGFLRVAHDIALYHHERWDGGGYPAGLAGRDIPLCARIVALADVFDALTTRRPYKDPWSSGKALRLIRRERGGQFDPAVVGAFLRRGEDVERIRLRYRDEELPAGTAA